MATWLIRAGSHGEAEGYVLEHGVAAVGWETLPDLSSVQTREALSKLVDSAYPDETKNARSNYCGQLWPLVSVIQVGDLIALPLKRRPTVAFGRVTGSYRFAPDAPASARHQLPVKWIREVPRSAINQDLRYSLGAFMTVCRVQRNDADRRLEAIADGKPDPVIAARGKDPLAEADDAEPGANLEELAMDQIRQTVYAKYKGHGLARIVGAVLEAQGYRVLISPAGADGGVDVIAGTGSLGFGAPKLVAQVKSDQAPLDVRVVRELQGVMKQFGAEQGLVVAWGGFNGAVQRETARQFFEIRLWTGNDLIQQMLNNYDALPADLRAELPLKRIWTLAGADEGIPG